MGEAEVHEPKKEPIAKLETFEDLLDLVGTNGRRNVFLFIVSISCAFLFPFVAVSYQFLGATPEYWCHISELTAANWTEEEIRYFTATFDNKSDHAGCQMYNVNYSQAAILGFEESLAEFGDSLNSSNTIQCSAREFDGAAPPTVVTQWDLVCDRRGLYSTTQTMVMVGMLVGSILWGYALDAFGRRRVILFCLVMYFISGTISAMVPLLGMYLVLRIVVAGVNVGIYFGGFVLTMEMCSIKQRSYIGSFFALPWALGYMVVPGIAYLLRPWYWLQIGLTFPVLFYIPYFWILPESPRWLIVNGRYEEAIQIMTKIAISNSKELPSSEVLISFMQKINEKEKKNPKSSRETFFSRTIKVISKITFLVRSKRLRSLTLMVFYCWCSVSLVYYGVSLSSTNIGADTYQYIFFGGLLEIPSYILLWPTVAIIGRKKTLVGLFFICAATILCVMITMLSEGKDASVGLMMFFSLVGKFAITAAFHLLYIMTAEFFPTSLRSLAVGESSVCARIGSVCSPYINDIIGESLNWMPSAVFGVFSMVAGTVSLFLPETKSKVLQDAIYSEEKDYSSMDTVDDTGRSAVGEGIQIDK